MPRLGYQHKPQPYVCTCGELKRTPLTSGLEEAEPYIQLGAFSTKQQLVDDFNQKLNTFCYRVPDSKVEFLQLEFVRREKKYIPDYCYPFSNEFLPAEDTQVESFPVFCMQTNLEFADSSQQHFRERTLNLQRFFYRPLRLF